MIVFSLVCAATFSLSTSAVPAQQVNSNAGGTALDDWVQNARDDALQNGIQFSLDHFNLDSTYLQWGHDIGFSNLQIAIRQWNYSASLVSNYSDLLESTKATIDAAHATLSDLQNQLTQARNAAGTQRPSSCSGI